jgi:hypothetical protein
MADQEIPLRTQSVHQCQATKSLEGLQAEVEVLRLDLRDMEAKHHEDTRRLWTRIVTLAVAVAVTCGNNEIINIIIGLIT